jgi:glycosyltransferase involved in cell wall biosynthesis
LKAQTLSHEYWELLVVDNASAKPIAEKYDISWHPNGRHIYEAELGTGYARRRGLAEFASDMVVFVDDDNVLSANYLEQAIAVGESHAFLGVWGGTNVPEFESDPPSWINEFHKCSRFARLTLFAGPTRSTIGAPNPSAQECACGELLRTSIADAPQLIPCLPFWAARATLPS